MPTVALMCNLYRMTKPIDEVAKLFETSNAAAGSNMGSEVYPGYPGLVIADGELKAMAWGFPLAMRSKRTGQSLKPKPVNNTRSDKLGSGFWRSSFEHRRCLIPISAFAEAEGERGSKTRTWASVPGAPVFACAGIWRWSDEWGEVYSMVMTDPNRQTAEIHNRMPVILKAEEQDLWSRGSPQEAFTLCRPFQGDLAIDRTTAPWVSR